MFDNFAAFSINWWSKERRAHCIRGPPNAQPFHKNHCPGPLPNSVQPPQPKSVQPRLPKSEHTPVGHVTKIRRLRALCHQRSNVPTTMYMHTQVCSPCAPEKRPTSTQLQPHPHSCSVAVSLGLDALLMPTSDARHAGQGAYLFSPSSSTAYLFSPSSSTIYLPSPSTSTTEAVTTDF